MTLHGSSTGNHVWVEEIDEILTQRQKDEVKALLNGID